MRIPINSILEELLGVSQISSKEQLLELARRLDELPPDTVIIDADKLEAAAKSKGK